MAKARITKIGFVHVGKNEGCCCDRCGQYLQNIWYVSFSNGQQIAFGIDCFEKVYKSGLSAYGQKEFRKLLKFIKIEEERIAYWKTVTEEKARSDGKLAWTFDSTESDSYWHGRSFEEYRQYEIECYSNALAGSQKELERYRKCGFEI